MFAHVTTYRLGTSAETDPEILRSVTTGEPVSDQAARTVASWWHSPAASCRSLTALSHGLPFDTDDLADTIDREVSDPDHAAVLHIWLADLSLSLSV